MGITLPGMVNPTEIFYLAFVEPESYPSAGTVTKTAGAFIRSRTATR